MLRQCVYWHQKACKNVVVSLSSTASWHIKEDWLKSSGGWFLLVSIKARSSQQHSQSSSWSHLIPPHLSVGGLAVVVFVTWTNLLYVRPGQYWDGWLSVGGYTTSACNQANYVNSDLHLSVVTKSSTSLNWLGVKEGMSPLLITWQVTLRPQSHTYGMRVPVVVRHVCELPYSIYFT